MTKTPPIPEEQQAFLGSKPDVADENDSVREQRPNIADNQPGDADVNTDEKGRIGNIKQNSTHQGYQQDR